MIVRERTAKNKCRKFIQKFGVWKRVAEKEVLRRRRRKHNKPDKLCNEAFHNLLSFPNIVTLIT
jgi:hypothetical protein